MLSRVLLRERSFDDQVINKTVQESIETICHTPKCVIVLLCSMLFDFADVFLQAVEGSFAQFMLRCHGARPPALHTGPPYDIGGVGRSKRTLTKPSG